MKILYLTNKPIYPIVDGGCFAMDSFLRSLLRFASVKHISVATHKHPFNIQHYPIEIAEQIAPEGYLINTKLNVFSFLKSIVTNTSYNVTRFYDTSFSDKISKEIQVSSFDFIILESAYMLIYLDDLKKSTTGKIVLRAPNVEYKIWEDYTRFSTSIFKKYIYNYLTHQLKKFEINAISRVDKVLAITANDKFQLESEGIQIPMEVIPFGVKIQNDCNVEIKKNKLFFLGAYNWKPNRDAALFLLKEILPTLSLTFPDIELHLAGTFMPESFQSYASKNCILHGKVDSSEYFSRNHGILVAPIFSGSGVRVKIVEALSYGLPVVASTIAMQGIPFDTVKIADSKSEFLMQITQLLQDEEAISNLQRNAIKIISEKFSEDSVSLALKESLYGN